MGIEASLKADVRVREISCGNYVVKEPEKFTNPPLVVVGNYEGKMDVSAGCIGGGLKIIKDLTLQICELKNENEKLKQQIPEIKPSEFVNYRGRYSCWNCYQEKSNAT